MMKLPPDTYFSQNQGITHQNSLLPWLHSELLKPEMAKLIVLLFIVFVDTN